MNNKKNHEAKQENKALDFASLKISVASPEKISEWSHGEVLKPETINYRTQKPERDGLFDERIFGPTKDWECYCGKYKKIRYKGVICDKCGVEVTRSSVRRERMGHIDLASPVSHIWYVRGVPSVLGLVIDLSLSELEKIIYFAAYVILDINEDIRKDALFQLEKEYLDLKKTNLSPLEKTQLEAQYKQTKQEIDGLKVKSIISEAKYYDLSLKYGQIIRVGIGAEAIYELLSKMDLAQTIKDLEITAEKTIGAQKRKLLKRLRILSDMEKAGIRPEWLVLVRIPVIPPDLRPMVQLDGGRFAASDLNDLYRRVINRNNRLKKLMSQGAPEVICRNEKRMLQEAVDALIDNSARRGKVVTTGTQRKLRSLSDMLKGKQGRFRQNLLGKRVDYSGRSVIVVGPHLKLHQCGLPKVMALELFKPFVISKLLSEGFVHNVKNASKLIEKGTPEVWDILEKLTKDAYVMLNRAPTLHRLGIQAFQPVLIEGKAIQLHPLVCSAFNADFDGDQMAVHLPLSKQAVYEASQIMRSSHNLLKPSSGEPIVSPRLDMVFGCYYMTSFEEGVKGEGKVFGGKNEAILAYQYDLMHIRAKIKVKMSLGLDKEDGLVETSVGRILFNNILPKELRFVNDMMDSKKLKNIVRRCFDMFGIEKTGLLVDKIKKIGFENATLSGMSIAIDDIDIPQNKKKIISGGDKKLEEIEGQYRRGLITAREKSIKSNELWIGVRNEIEKNMISDFDKNSPIFIMVSSGARGSINQLTQMAGMKGLLVNPSGEIIEIPVKANFKEGLDVLEYFISTHGARKGKSDTALRTSDAGYLSRRLVDVAQDIVISSDDCGTKIGVEITAEEAEEMSQSFDEKVLGRVLFSDVKSGKKTLGKAGQEIDEKLLDEITKENIKSLSVRSVMTCANHRGVCKKCYGRDLSTGKLVNIGEAVGIMAAQAIGEPGTQLTLKTFHMGGVSGEDITTGLPRVEELFEARTPRVPAVISEINGRLEIKPNKDQMQLTITSSDFQSEEYLLEEDYEPVIKNNDLVKAKQAIATARDKKAIRSMISGVVQISKNKKIIKVTSKEKTSRDYTVNRYIGLKVNDGDMVVRGDILTEGHLDLSQSLKLRGAQKTQKYIVKCIQEIYTSQGQSINEKHVEIMLKQMFSKILVKDNYDSDLLPGQIIDRIELGKINDDLKKKGKKEVEYDDIILGVTRVALKTESFLSAASFQETTGILIEAAIKGKVDHLNGLKENVIIGRLIPAGTGFRKQN
ncbi:DNA-directed RNA polymerase subunit beta' [Candidatus Berkelbacteria bacterium RIFCSPHIGHO2_12_FULL_36_9]|uniref:DNA-directed RNA polymerase subunit beta' n=1 Tax=Candidatus Berkelbacteria bacterium RIFCSPHIGHO2_12_FULL_36_9 TaxID=1797469 RepID=A0A1F5EHK4_9BACT|nr:MAG: DNA-directed RNA polymerase subunit beta' [Candidatus Berkelbacteria bacterium RIFCSPHIGHO2_12_FULL_36_9]